VSNAVIPYQVSEITDLISILGGTLKFISQYLKSTTTNDQPNMQINLFGEERDTFQVYQDCHKEFQYFLATLINS
jgi:hypothetical protein